MINIKFMFKKLFIPVVFIFSACSSQVGKDYPFDSSSENSLVLLSVSSPKYNKSLGSLVRIVFVEVSGSESNFKVNNSNQFSLRESASLASTLTGSDSLTSHFEKKQYYLLKAKPGTYALKEVVNNISYGGSQIINKLCVLQSAPVFDIKPGQVSFLGDFELVSHGSSYQRLNKISSDVSEAKGFMSANSKSSALIVEVPNQILEVSSSCAK